MSKHQNTLEQAFRLTTQEYTTKGQFDKGYDAFFLSYMKGAKIKKKDQGFQPYRYNNNPNEKLWALNWAGQSRQDFIPDLTKREDQITATIVQWMGSSVGQSNMTYLLCALPSNDKINLIRRLQESLDCHQ